MGAMADQFESVSGKNAMDLRGWKQPLLNLSLQRFDLRKWRRFVSFPARRFSDRYQNLKDYLGDVLEGQRSLLAPGEDPARTEAPFVIRDDIEILLERSLPRGAGRGLGGLEIFARLAPFFEAGFYLGSSGSSYRLRSMFIWGRTFFPSSGDEIDIDISVPKISRHDVLKGRGEPVLKAFQLERLVELRASSAFMLAPEEGSVLILICNRPHPWQMGVIEDAHRVIVRLYEAEARSHQVQKGQVRKGQVRKGLFR